MQQKKNFDPRNTSITNPFVQSYLDKQTERAKPLSERQKLLNVLLACGMILNLGIMGVVAYALYFNSATNTTQSVVQQGEQTFNIAEAMEKIRSMEASLLSMRSSVELHRNAYYKLEQEHETMKSVIVQAVPVGADREVTSNYAPPSMKTLPNPQLESADAQEVARRSRAVQEQVNQESMAIKVNQ